MVMRRMVGGALGLVAVASAVAIERAPAASADARPVDGQGRRGVALEHVGSFFVPDNLAEGEPLNTPTSAEIAAMTDDGRLLYVDALAGRLGVVDIDDPAAPQPLGAVELPGAPTSVAVHGRWALVAIVTNEDFDNPTGELLVMDAATLEVERSIELAGQPDAVTVSPSRRYAAIVIENQRDEDDNDGLLPQPPPGALQILEVRGHPANWGLRTVPLTGLADVFPEDPEPEYVDINRRDEAVVSLQENNHLVIVDLRRARVVDDFSAGTVDVPAVDTTEEALGPQGNGVISLDGELQARRREPDSVAWVDDDTFATANEGDYVDAGGVEGGSRSFTLFNRSGSIEFEAANTLEHEIVAAGHYPEARSENKGNEPEGLEVGHFRGRTLLFVGSERANVVGVYDVTRGDAELRPALAHRDRAGGTGLRSGAARRHCRGRRCR